MRVIETNIPGPVIIEPTVHADERGAFVETWQESRYMAHGLPGRLVQDNVSRSVHGVLRGLHFQHPHAQGKLVTVVAGTIFDVAVDIRVGSPTYGRWSGVELDEASFRQFYIPPGFAHGFQTTSAIAVVHYKCSAYYDAASDRSISWNDEDLGIEWPVAPTLSPKDRQARRLRDYAPAELPSYSPT